MEKSMQPDPAVLGKTKEIIEVFGKVIIGLLAVCYASGLLMVNLYYSRFGVYSLSLFRLNYVVGGLWVFLPIVILSLVAGGVFAISALGAHNPNSSRRQRVTINLVTLLMQVFFLSAVLLITALLTAELKIALPTRSWFLLAMSSSVVVTSFYLLFFFLLNRSPRHWRLYIAGFGILLSLSYLAHIVQFPRFFEGVPAHLGGGATTDVQLLLNANESDKKFFELSGLNFYPNSNWTRTARLLFATDDEYVLLVRSPEWSKKTDSSTLSIRKDLVRSVLYVGLRGGGGGASFGADSEPNPQLSPAVPASGSTPEALPSSSPNHSPNR